MVDSGINTITILGANGTLGKGVAELCTNMTRAKLYLVSREKVCSLALVEELKHQGADPLRLIACDYSNLPECVTSSDWIFESVQEDLTVKQEINLQIDQNLREGAFVSTGTSSYTIEELAKPCSAVFKRQYYGTHFFNPPNRLPLFEFVPTSWSDPKATEAFKEFFIKNLKRDLITLKDKKGFLANRVGISLLHEASKLTQIYASNGGINYIDTIMGSFTGRKLPPMKTIDYIGIDVYLKIIENLSPLKARSEIPKYLYLLLQRGWKGSKGLGGCYTKEIADDGNIHYFVFDVESNSHQVKIPISLPFVETMTGHLLQGNITKAFKTLREEDSFEAMLCKYLLVHYIFTAHQAAIDVVYEIEAIDTAMEQGYGWLSPRKMVTLLGGIEGVKEIIQKNESLNLVIEHDDLRWIDNFMAPVSESDLRFFPLIGR